MLIILFLPYFSEMWVQTLKVQSRATKALVKRFIQDYFFFVNLYESFNFTMILWKHAYWNQRFVKWYRNEIHNQFKFSNLLVRIFAPVTRGIPWYVSKVLLRDPPLNWICRFPVKWLDTNWLVYFYAFGALILISITFSV